MYLSHNLSFTVYLHHIHGVSYVSIGISGEHETTIRSMGELIDSERGGYVVRESISLIPQELAV